MFRVHKNTRREMAINSRGSSKSESKEELMVTSHSLETLNPNPRLKNLSQMNVVNIIESNRPSGLNLGETESKSSLVLKSETNNQ